MNKSLKIIWLWLMNEFSTTVEYLKIINICIWFATFPQNTATKIKQQETIIFRTRTIFRYNNCIDLLAICLGSNLAHMSHSQSKPVVYGHVILFHSVIQPWSSVIQTWFMETCPQRYTTPVYGHVSTVGYGNVDCAHSCGPCKHVNGVI